MKKILAFLALFVALSAQAQQNVTIYYGWSAADAAANFHRTLAIESNKIQKKYNIISHKSIYNPLHTNSAPQ